MTDGKSKDSSHLRWGKAFFVATSSQRSKARVKKMFSVFGRRVFCGWPKARRKDLLEAQAARSGRMERRKKADATCEG